MKKHIIFLALFFLPLAVKAAAQYSGTTSTVVIPSQPYLIWGASNSFTISCWINALNVNQAGGIVFKRDNTFAHGFTGYGIIVLNNTSSGPGKSIANYYNDGANFVGWATRDSVIDGNPHQITAVFNFVGTTTSIYIDGINFPLVNPVGNNLWPNYTDDFPKGSGSPLNTPLTIGSQTGQNFFTGTIDDVRVYNRALSISEIQSLGNSRHRALITTGLVGWYFLDDGTLGSLSDNALVLDHSSQKNNGNAQNLRWSITNWINYK